MSFTPPRPLPASPTTNALSIPAPPKTPKPQQVRLESLEAQMRQLITQRGILERKTRSDLAALKNQLATAVGDAHDLRAQLATKAENDKELERCKAEGEKMRKDVSQSLERREVNGCGSAGRTSSRARGRDGQAHHRPLDPSHFASRPTPVSPLAIASTSSYWKNKISCTSRLRLFSQTSRCWPRSCSRYRGWRTSPDVRPPAPNQAQCHSPARSLIISPLGCSHP